MSVEFLGSPEFYLRAIEGHEHTLRPLPLSYTGGKVTTERGPLFFRLIRQENPLGFLLYLTTPTLYYLDFPRQRIACVASCNISSSGLAASFKNLEALDALNEQGLTLSSGSVDTESLTQFLLRTATCLTRQAWWPMIRAATNIHYVTHCRYIGQPLDEHDQSLAKELAKLPKSDQALLLTHTSKAIRQTVMSLIFVPQSPLP